MILFFKSDFITETVEIFNGFSPFWSCVFDKKEINKNIVSK